MRPTIAWAFELDDVLVYSIGGAMYLAYVSRDVKMHPEYLTTPNRRDIQIPMDASHPLAIIAYGVWRAQRARVDWCTLLRRVSAS